MIGLSLIGIGAGNPDHLTRQAIREINEVDLILIPQKGAGKDELAHVRQQICDEVLSPDNPPKIVPFTLPVRDPKTADYKTRVNDWHDAIAKVWLDAIKVNLGETGRVGLLVWGDPSLYDSTLRIAQRVEKKLPLTIKVIPGITALQALTAAHAIPVNEIGAPFVVTTGRQLRDNGWPQGVDTCAIMLDGECSFTTLKDASVHIWWTAYAGMEGEISVSGPLHEVSDTIIEKRSVARDKRGWIMDMYLMRKDSR
ncbi:MAG: precorrin-6A synthase (deacetylating) [Cohaesibacter sp.]|jgi:precorrin-6A synthase|nr:precorrin-6A synthase (deacetylating) [Cohaesibacter sp.]